tara:strand:- start:757 stop:3003 length:2247 start_codon:yes stop_codon:yes gene_type:complete
MVVSKINNKISYTEIKTIDENDKGRDVSMYKINLFKIPVVIALGDIKFTYSEDNILFTPVYLVVDEYNKIYQIGVYEFDSKLLENIKDDDGDIDISLIDGPLLYSFINKDYINKCMKNEKIVPDYDSGDDEEDKDGDDKDDGDDEVLEELDDDDEDIEDDEDKEKKDSDKLKNPPPVLVELNIEDDDDDFLQKGEDEKEDKKEKDKFEKPGISESSWIEHFMNNNNYGIKDNKGKGDCFFYTIRDAYKSINIDVSVKKQRDILSDKVDDSVFNNYKERYDMLYNEIKNLNKETKIDKKNKSTFIKKYNKLAKESKSEKDIPTKKNKIKEAKKIKKNIVKIKESLVQKEKELINAKKNIEQVKWFENIKDMEQLKKKIKTCDYWADAWGIPTMELAINTKFIILSSNQYQKGNNNRVINCGDFVPNQIEKKGYFKPKYYVIIEHTGDHYRLITYKDKEIFRFHELPYGIKNDIVKKCMKSKGKTLYNYIPKFAKLIGETINIPIVKKENESEENKPTEININTEPEIEEIVEMTPTPTPEDKDLFNHDTVFVFYSKSAHKPPGKGSGEKIKDGDKEKYAELSKIKNWRRVLSNFYMKEKDENGKVKPLFELDGLKWASVEHYYHANKFKKNNPDFYRLFSIDSGSSIMDDAKKALGAGGKTGKISGKQFRPKDIVMDEDFEDGKNKEIVMEKGQQSKYEQDELSQKVLLLTKDAKLEHYVQSRKKKEERPPNVIFYDTMRIRNKLKKKN